jgi:ribosomal protein S18 acetylase RimI-like enzyme
MGHELTRVATAADAERVARLLHDFQAEFDEPSPGPAVLAERLRGAMGRDEAVFLLAPDGVAVLSFRPTALYGLVALLEELYVAPPARGRGQGRALLEHAMAVARERGAVSIELNTGEDDWAARRLYTSAGFTNLDRATRLLYYERGL